MEQIEMPDDFADAFVGLRLAVLRQKQEGWRELSQEDAVLALLQLLEACGEQPPKRRKRTEAISPF